MIFSSEFTDRAIYPIVQDGFSTASSRNFVWMRRCAVRKSKDRKGELDDHHQLFEVEAVWLVFGVSSCCCCCCRWLLPSFASLYCTVFLFASLFCCAALLSCAPAWARLYACLGRPHSRETLTTETADRHKLDKGGKLLWKLQCSTGTGWEVVKATTCKHGCRQIDGELEDTQ